MSKTKQEPVVAAQLQMLPPSKEVGVSEKISEFYSLVSLVGEGCVDGFEVYVSKSGDTLSKVSKKKLGDYSRYMEIADASGIEDPDVLGIGKELRIPCVTGNSIGNTAKVYEGKAPIKRDDLKPNAKPRPPLRRNIKEGSPHSLLLASKSVEKRSSPESSELNVVENESKEVQVSTETGGSLIVSVHGGVQGTSRADKKEVRVITIGSFDPPTNSHKTYSASVNLDSF
ncbi:MAG: hypothetical protein Q7S09_06015 [bacterium]|nr:hypothetical protein [bacterium]